MTNPDSPRKVMTRLGLPAVLRQHWENRQLPGEGFCRLCVSAWLCPSEQTPLRPSAMVGDSHLSRRRKCKMPPGLPFKTKPRLAAEMYRELREESIIPFKYVVADSVYGASPDFVGAIEERVGTTYFVRCDRTPCVSSKSRPLKQRHPWQARYKSETGVPEGEKKPMDFATVARGINSFFWYRRKVSEGTKEPIEYEFTKRRITLCKDGLPCKTVWLIIKRTLGANRQYSYYISNAPLSTRLRLSYGSAVCVQPSNSASRKQSPSLAWITMR